MPKIFFDIESRSAVSLEDAGVFRYASDPSTDVLCVTYVIDDGEPQIWLPGRPVPEDIIAVAKQNPDWIAHNIMFDRPLMTHIVQPRYGWPEIPLERQICTMSLALANALPGALDKAAAALGLPLRKDRRGYLLMRKMSRPLRRRKKDPPGLRWYEPTAEEREIFHDYAKRDPVLSRLLYQALPPLPPSEQALFVLDTIVNERGFHVDVALAQAARNIAHSERLAINAEIAKHTEGEITSVDQTERIKTFVRRHGHVISSLNRRSVAAVLMHEPGDKVRRLLELRREGAKASVRKLDRLLASVDSDDRLRGTLRYHASSTGRWSGRGYQPQNLKKIETTDVDAAVEAILSGDMDRVRELGAPLTVAADISRGIVCAEPGHVLMGGDFSAVESRDLAWFANELWKLEAYRKYDETGDPQYEPYCVMASQALKRTVTPDDEAGRNFGKTYDLAFGFGGGLGAWRKFDNSDTYSDVEIEQFKYAYRDSHPATVRFWHELERAAHACVFTRRRIELGRLSFEMKNGTLLLTLPSGRQLSYPEARLMPGKFEGTRELQYKDNARGGWTDFGAWYGTLVENVVQATARDLLAAAMLRLEAAGYPVVLHVHDEIISEVPEGFGSIEEFQRLLTAVPDWAAGLPLAAKAWTRQRYAKNKTATTAGTMPATINGAALDAPAAQTKIEVPPAPPKPSKPAAPVTENDEDDEDGPSWTEIPLADLIAEPLVGGKVLCPFHDDHTPSLQIYPDHFHCYVCGAGGNHLDWLMRVEGMSREEALDLLDAWDGPRQVQVCDDGGEARRTFALRLWDEAQPIAGTLAARYLSDTRRIDLAALPANIDEALRFHPRCPFGRGNRNPCLIALMRDARADTPTGIQRIGLTADAKKIDRLMLGRSGIVKLWPAGAQLVVGEGLETVCAAASRIPYNGAPLQPAWSALSAEGLGQFPILPGIQRLIILVDHDPPGKTAASYCAGRWERAGRSVIQLTPDEPGFDFNDIVMAE
jgi:DNA polymerase